MNDKIKLLAADADAKQTRLLKLSKLVMFDKPALVRIPHEIALEQARSASYAADQTLRNALILLNDELARDRKIEANQEARREKAEAPYRDSEQEFESEQGARRFWGEDK